MKGAREKTQRRKDAKAQDAFSDEPRFISVVSISLRLCAAAFSRLSRAFRLTSLAVAALALVSLTSCVRGCASRRPPIHLNPNMDDQPRYDPLAASPFFASGSASQKPVSGTIARGELRDDDVFYSGRNFFGYASIPLDVTPELVARGRDRFAIYCTPCHGESGDGHGKLYERTGVEAANLHDERIRQMPDGQIFNVITNGQGLMRGYRFPVTARDRWAIVAYVRELQKR